MRTIGISTESGLTAYCTSNAALRVSLAVELSFVSPTSSTSIVESDVLLATRPGVTTPPWASMILAPAGTLALAPTAAIRPADTTMTPDAISPAGPIE